MERLMADHVILLSVPGLRQQDLAHMPQTQQLFHDGDRTTLVPSFPAVTWPVQANMLTGQLPAQHGVVANGFFWRERGEVEMWTAWNDKIQAPQIWDILRQQRPQLSSAVWFPMLSKGCGANYVCMPAPIHNPDGSESLWCYTQPTELYGELRDQLGHFPLQHFWGPLAGIPSTAWIVDSAVLAARRFQPNFFYLYLPHLDYQAQKLGPDSEAAQQAVRELDTQIGKLAEGFGEALPEASTTWLLASEYTIVPVDHVLFPNRLLREAGLLRVHNSDAGEQLDLTSPAWALVDHQLAHVFVHERDPAIIRRVTQLFDGVAGIDEVLNGDQLEPYGLCHERTGDVVLVSTPNSWQAYYWWLDDAQAPAFARTVDIHRKPGYDPVELHFDMATKSTPLDATRIRGSHGAPARQASQRGVLLASQKGVFVETDTADTDVADIVLRQFGI